MNLLTLPTLWIGKSLQALVRLSGSGGAAFPGLVVEKINKSVISDLARKLPDGVIVVSGTNGKTTTCRFLVCLLGEDKVIHNRTGSNMTRGHLSAFLESFDWLGRPKGKTCAVLETDEAVLPQTLKLVCPKIVLLLNLFRDQLDRYGEVDSLVKKWSSCLSDFQGTVIGNADDPNITYLMRNFFKTKFFGLEDERLGTKNSTSTTDAYLSPASGKPLEYNYYYLSHLGNYFDPHSDFKRPKATFLAQDIKLAASGGQTSFKLVNQQQDIIIETTLPGLYNTYNILAACAVALETGVNIEGVPGNILKTQGVFGRFEGFKINNHDLVFCLIKNPAGAFEIVKTIALENQTYDLAFCANDNFADGLDVSWYFDTDFSSIATHANHMYFAGNRRYDMALRQKYAGATCESNMYDSIDNLIDSLVDHCKKDDLQSSITYILSTYTATLEVQRRLAELNVKARYFKE